MDFAGPHKGKVYLIVVDAMSKWLEVDIMKSMSSAEVIQSFRRIFARMGIPDLIISDNGRSFDSKELHEFYDRNLIKYSTISPYHPSSNGQAERMVQTAKKILTKLEEGDVELQVQRLLFRQHTTVHAGTEKTPAELLMGRKLRTVLDKMHPYALQWKNKGDKNTTQKLRSFEIGDLVYFRNYNPIGPKWLQGKVHDCTGPVSYTVQLPNGNIIKRHVDQLRRRIENAEDDQNKQIVDKPQTQSNQPRIPVPAQIIQSPEPESPSFAHSPDQNVSEGLERSPFNEDPELRAERTTNLREVASPRGAELSPRVDPPGAPNSQSRPSRVIVRPSRYKDYVSY